MARNTYGLDLGSYEIKVYDKKQDAIWTEKSVIAMKEKQEIFAIGDEAYKMYEKTPDSIEVLFPMKAGVISGFHDMQFLLQNLLKANRQLAHGSAYVIAVPTDVTEVQKKAFFDLVIHSTARAKEVNIVERSIADAIGLDIDTRNTNGVFIVNFGGETTELSVLAAGGMILNRLLPIGGRSYDQAIITLIRNSHDFLIGSHTAEALRRRFEIFKADSDAAFMVAGRDLITGVPTQKTISINLVRAAIKEPLLECLRAIRSLLDRTPPEIRKSIRQNGIFLTGGIANTEGLDAYIEKNIGIPTRAAENPEICSVTGLKKIIMSKELSQLAYSMLDERYRWMR